VTVEKSLPTIEEEPVPWFKSVAFWLTIMIMCYVSIYFILW